MIRLVPALVLICVLCACSRTSAIVVGSKNFTEQLILGEIAAQQLERSRILNEGIIVLLIPPLLILFGLIWMARRRSAAPPATPPDPPSDR